MAKLKYEEFTVPFNEKNHILIEDIVDKYVNNHIAEGARLISIDSDGAVFEWSRPMTEEEHIAEADAKREEQAKIDAEEADDRKAGF